LKMEVTNYDPVVPLARLPKLGDQLVFSDEVDKWLYPEMREEMQKCSIFVYRSEDWTGGYVIGVSCGLAKQEFLLKHDGTPGWAAAWYTSWSVFYWYYPGGDAIKKEIDTEELKKLREVRTCAEGSWLRPDL
jgi:hypothetical protein